MVRRKEWQEFLLEWVLIVMEAFIVILMESMCELVIREGDDSNGEIMLNIDGNYIRTGASKDGAIVYIIDGNYIRYGDYSDRRIAYNMTESSLGSGCFITTACIESRGLPVDCYELETLRKFRDNWVSKHENGPAEIGIYYEIAPKIVEKLDCLPNSKEIYEKIYQEVVLKCVRFIEEGKEEDAYLLYKNASFDLKKYTDTL